MFGVSADTFSSSIGLYNLCKQNATRTTLELNNKLFS